MADLGAEIIKIERRRATITAIWPVSGRGKRAFHAEQSASKALRWI